VSTISCNSLIFSFCCLGLLHLTIDYFHLQFINMLSACTTSNIYVMLSQTFTLMEILHVRNNPCHYFIRVIFICPLSVVYLYYFTGFVLYSWSLFLNEDTLPSYAFIRLLDFSSVRRLPKKMNIIFHIFVVEFTE